MNPLAVLAPAPQQPAGEVPPEMRSAEEVAAAGNKKLQNKKSSFNLFCLKPLCTSIWRRPRVKIRSREERRANGISADGSE